MATNFPTSLDDSSNIPNPAAGNFQNSPDHASLHGNTGDGLKAVEAKLGTGASTPVVSRLLFGTGTGTSAWTQLTSAQLAASLTDETGTGLAVFATTPTLVTPKVDTINESTPANGVTIDGLNIKDNALTTASSVPTVALQDSSVTSAKVATGMPVQMVYTTSSAVATGTTVIPLDDTIPQITEGTEFMTLAITPKSATNILTIRIVAMLASSVADNHVLALFQDATVNALATTSNNNQTSATARTGVLEHSMVAGTTSSTTFRFRGGGSQAGTTTFNGVSGVRIYGAITKSSIVITEYKA